MGIWKISVSAEVSGQFNEYYGCARTAKEAIVKGLALAKRDATENNLPSDDELYVSEVAFVSNKDF